MRCHHAQVVTLVKGLAKDSVTIVATIHSPTANTFSLFNRWVFSA